MCGIVGKFDFSGAPVSRELIQSMCATIRHRGPDDEGIYAADGVGLGQRRLAIIDLDPSAAAPLANEDASLWITYNGELYNFRELRAELEARGHHFRTHGDTEVIVHLYQEYGARCVDRMRGMFAFAIWDSRRRELFAARDRVGKKPFIYTRTPHALLFASEMRALFVDPEVTVAPDMVAIDEYLSYQYVPSPMTAFAGVCKLPPGHTFLCDARGNIKIERYWEPSHAPKSRASEEELAEELRERLREAVRIRLVSDVPVGAFLSGGVDSSAVVAFMAQETSGPVRTFSIGFDEQSHDERPYARLVAERYGTNHHEFVVRPNAAEVLPLLVHHYNEPFADSSALPTYYVSKLTRDHVTVALSGDGGDESFAGYRNYGAVLAWSRLDAIPSPLRHVSGRTLAALMRRLPYSWAASSAGTGAMMLAGDVPSRFRLQTTVFKPQEKAAAYTDHFRALLQGRKETPVSLQWSEGMDALDWMMRHDQRFYLADCLMVKTDIASMANSLEVRCPLLDHEFMEFAATIPSAMKRGPDGGKGIFKRAMQSLLPEPILTRSKRGFALPLAAWFRGELAPLLEDALLGERAAKRDLIQRQFVRRIIDEHARGARDWSGRLWALLFLELWFREYID